MKTTVLVTCLALACTSGAWADPWNKKTNIEIKESVLIPGKQLPPGKYVLKLVDSPSNRHIVQIFNADETKVEATVLAIPNYRLQPTGKTAIGFWETPAGVPPALRSWFYPGDNFGQEFAYPKKIADQLASVNHTKVPWYTGEETATYEASTLRETEVHDADQTPAPSQLPVETATAEPVKTPEPAPQAEVAEAKPEQPRQEEVVIAQNRPPATPPAPFRDEAPAPETLPQTASPYGALLIGGLGLAAMGLSLSRSRVS